MLIVTRNTTGVLSHAHRWNGCQTFSTRFHENTNNTYKWTHLSRVHASKYMLETDKEKYVGANVQASNCTTNTV